MGPMEWWISIASGAAAGSITYIILELHQLAAICGA